MRRSMYRCLMITSSRPSPSRSLISSWLGANLRISSISSSSKRSRANADFAVLQRVGHAADAVVLLDQQVLALDLLARGVLLRREVVLDDLEHVGERRQVEHQHHHALDAGRDAELVAGMLQVVQEVAVEQRLALLGQAERVVDLAARLARHQRAQELHVGRRHFHVDHEVGAREARTASAGRPRRTGRCRSSACRAGCAGSAARTAPR